MPDRIKDLIAAIDKLIQKSRVMAKEQKKIWRELEELRQELAAIRQAARTIVLSGIGPNTALPSVSRGLCFRVIAADMLLKCGD